MGWGEVLIAAWNMRNVAIPNPFEPSVHPMSNNQPIDKPAKACELPLSSVKFIRAIKDAEVLVDPRFLDVGALASPLDIWVLQAICSRAVGT